MNRTFVVHDVLQTRLLSLAQQKAQDQKPFFDRFKECMTILEKEKVKLAIIANGVDLEPKWANFIKKNKWEVQLHGLFHHTMKHLSEDEAYLELREGKEILEQYFEQKITEFFPPKLAFSNNLFNACIKLGLTMNINRWRPIHVIQGENIPEVYLHFWSEGNLRDTKQCLQLPANT